jgi:hypothetical protein
LLGRSQLKPSRRLNKCGRNVGHALRTNILNKYNKAKASRETTIAVKRAWRVRRALTVIKADASTATRQSPNRRGMGKI